MLPLIVTYDQLPYGGVMYRKGETFLASEHDARLLIGFQKAKLDDKAMRAPIPDMDAPPKAKKRSYRRRDMKADK